MPNESNFRLISRMPDQASPRHPSILTATALVNARNGHFELVKQRDFSNNFPMIDIWKYN
jgi:hypothetical protein